MKRTIIACVALVIIASCSKIVSPTEPTAATAKIITTAIDVATNQGLANVIIEVRQAQAGPVLFTGKTNSSGLCEIALPPGTYWVRPVPPTGYSLAASGAVDLIGKQLTLGAGETAALTVPLMKQ